jgi:hypothetical protein
MPRARVKTAIVVKAGDLRKLRTAYRKSGRNVSLGCPRRRAVYTCRMRSLKCSSSHRQRIGVSR